MVFVRAYVRWRYRARHDLARMQRLLPERQNPAPVPADAEDSCDVVSETVAGRTVVTLTPRADRSDVHVVHLHGGAYVYSIQAAHWRALARLAVASGATIHVPLYPLAPGATVDDAHAFLDQAVGRVRDGFAESPRVLSGDTARGGLARGQ
jgi:acetyl esterase/lipase